ncbi:MAG TPA: ABC transporter permease [Bryobacteraceae bacterium]|nr:ABC transporter permease [Bryobacteraceae bacterium]
MFWKKRKQSDFNSEIESHLALEADDLAEEGANPGDAKHQAKRAFGNVVASHERFYESRRWIWLEQLAQDLRYGLRTLRRNPGFTLIAVLSLALGIGANTAVFSLVDEVVLKTLPVRAPNELRILQWVRGHDGLDVSTSGYNTPDPVTGQLVCGSFSYRIFQTFRQSVPQFSDLVGYARQELTVTTGGASDYAYGHFVSGNYFAALGAQPLLGRPILDSDDAPGRPEVAVLTHTYWAKRFALDPGVVGRVILINQRPVTVIGVMQPRFQGLYPGHAVDFFVPLSMTASIGPKWFSLSEPDAWWVQIFGRLRPGISDQTAQASLQASFAHAIEAFAKQAKTPALVLRPGARGVGSLRDGSSRTLSILSVVVCLVLLIACVNLANLLVARSMARRREIAVRLSIGAGTGRLVRQLLTESLLLAGIGGALGLALAPPLLKILVRLISGSQSLGLDAGIDARTLAFTLTVTLLAGLLFGTLPAWRATRVNLAPTLKEGASGAGGGPRLRLSGMLVSAQVALSLLLLVGAGLFVRTLLQLAAVDLGFHPESLLTFDTDPSRSGYQAERLKDVYRRLQTNLAAIPGVESVAMSQERLLQDSEWDTGVYVPTRTEPPKRNSALLLYCSANFLSTLRIPAVLGRDLNDSDENGSDRVAVVNQLFADRYFPGTNPLGQIFYLGDGKAPAKGEQPFRIAGIAKNAHYTGVREDLSPIAYLPYTKLDGLHEMTFVIRTTLPPLTIASAVRRAVAETDPAIPVAYLKTEEQQAAESIATERLFAGLVGAFAAVAALLAAIGLYGVMAYSVARRTIEIGVRLALGARRSAVQWMVLRQSLWMVALGLALGIPAALALTGLVEKFLFGIKPTDVVSFIAAGLLMAAVGAAAAWIPARRAARVDPMKALRCE